MKSREGEMVPNVEWPLVSCVMATWNGERYLREAIDSALSQDYPRLEVIVVDDGSTDATQEICLSYGDRIQYFRQEKDDKDGMTAFVRMCEEASGTYLAVLDHDDRWLAGKISRQVAALANAPATGACFTDGYVIDSAGVRCGLLPFRGISGDVYHDLLEQNRFCHSSVMFTKDAYASAGGYSLATGVGDWDLWLRIARRRPILFLEEPLVEYRIHPHSFSRNPSKMVAALRTVIKNQRHRWHPACSHCRVRSARGYRNAANAYVQHFHYLARGGAPMRSVATAYWAAASNAPATFFSPRQLAASARSLWFRCGRMAANRYARARHRLPL